MDIITVRNLDDPLWPPARRLYHRSFAREGRKSDAVIAAMFAKGMCSLHAVMRKGEEEADAMAITGLSGDGRALLIDYLAVRDDLRGRGIGERFVAGPKAWASENTGADGIVIEVEADPGAGNERRIRFWEKCGFTAADYVHQYIWVPEPYRAMKLSFEGKEKLPDKGEELFRYITAFHKRAYSR